jgi:hypothetical protein
VNAQHTVGPAPLPRNIPNELRAPRVAVSPCGHTDRARSKGMDEAGRVIRAKYAVATDGATTKQGGAVTAGRSGAQLEGRNVARVGDEVMYPDGSKAWITMGCWRAVVRSTHRSCRQPLE